MIQKPKCGSCYYFQDAGLGGSGWCHHPQRKSSAGDMIMVRSNELSCRDEWSRTLWKPSIQPSEDIDWQSFKSLDGDDRTRKELATITRIAGQLSRAPGQRRAERPEGAKAVSTAQEPEPTRALQVFLCHASSDKPVVRNLYRRLVDNGIEPWFDEESLLPGQHWQAEIPKAVRKSDVVIVCLSCASVSKAGYVQKEISFALDVAEEQPEGSIFLIPLRLEECVLPDRLRRYQRADLYSPIGFDRLMKSLSTRSAALGLKSLS
jgi:hypothetical protein